jgi:hypothetical protein
MILTVLVSTVIGVGLMLTWPPSGPDWAPVIRYDAHIGWRMEK